MPVMVYQELSFSFCTHMKHVIHVTQREVSQWSALVEIQLNMKAEAV